MDCEIQPNYSQVNFYLRRLGTLFQHRAYMLLPCVRQSFLRIGSLYAIFQVASVSPVPPGAWNILHLSDQAQS